MSAAVDMLRRLAAAGIVDRYGCPCGAEGRITEERPGIFVLRYEHDDWCPVLAGRGAA